MNKTPITKLVAPSWKAVCRYMAFLKHELITTPLNNEEIPPAHTSLFPICRRKLKAKAASIASMKKKKNATRKNIGLGRNPGGDKLIAKEIQLLRDEPVAHAHIHAAIGLSAFDCFVERFLACTPSERGVAER